MRRDNRTSPVRTKSTRSASPESGIPADHLVSPLEAWKRVPANGQAWERWHTQHVGEGSQVNQMMPLRLLYNPMVARCAGSQLQREGWCLDG